jgi:hypothetical protein
VFDFTIKIYNSLLEALSKQGFSFQTFTNFIQKPGDKIIVLRHDVDQLPDNSVVFSGIEAEKNIKGTFYFRSVPESWDEAVIKEIAEMGHEVGYHYEDVSLMAGRQKTKVTRQKLGQDKRQKSQDKRQEEEHNQDYEKYLAEIAIESFKMNLEKLRKIAPVKTICMHGSPMSKWDSRLLWKYYDYRDFGIIGEPYFDVNFSRMLYLTDTGRTWCGGNVNIRDKGLGIRDEGLGNDFYKDWKVRPVQGSLMNMTPESLDFQSKYKFRSTSDIIKAAEEGKLPDKIMMTLHPQRWTDRPIPWVRELVWQNVKNVGKYFVVKVNSE